jgi:hypothetical protein
MACKRASAIDRLSYQYLISLNQHYLNDPIGRFPPVAIGIKMMYAIGLQSSHFPGNSTNATSNK